MIKNSVFLLFLFLNIFVLNAMYLHAQETDSAIEESDITTSSEEIDATASETEDIPDMKRVPYDPNLSEEEINRRAEEAFKINQKKKHAEAIRRDLERKQIEKEKLENQKQKIQEKINDFNKKRAKIEKKKVEEKNWFLITSKIILAALIIFLSYKIYKRKNR